MPQTAKLSRAFYNRLGDDVANELVGLLNVMDSTYLSELRQLNDLNFARFDAKVGQRFAESDARFGAWMAAFEQRFVEFEAKVEKRFVEMEARFEQRLAEFEAKFERRLAEQHQSLLRWMFGLWIVAMAGIGGLYLQIALLR